MPIDPLAPKATPNMDRQRLNAGAANAAMRNKGQQGAAMRAKPTPMAKPNIGQPAVPLGVNKKKPVLAPGSVRANAMRESLGNREMDMQRQQAQMAMQAKSAMQAQQGALDVGPSQLPFMPPGSEMAGDGMSQYDPNAMQSSNMLADQLAMQQAGGLGIGPSTLPFNPNSGIAGNQVMGTYPNPGMNNPMGSRPGQFGPVNPQIQQGLAAGRNQNMQQMDAQRRQMQMNRMRGGY
jgi:hypothetical protein